MNAVDHTARLPVHRPALINATHGTRRTTPAKATLMNGVDRVTSPGVR